jgi:hypothetical protein
MNYVISTDATVAEYRKYCPNSSSSAWLPKTINPGNGKKIRLYNKELTGS